MSLKCAHVYRGNRWHLRALLSAPCVLLKRIALGRRRRSCPVYDEVVGVQDGLLHGLIALRDESVQADCGDDSSANDVAVMVYASGSTGTPKGVKHDPCQPRHRRMRLRVVLRSLQRSRA